MTKRQQIKKSKKDVLVSKIRKIKNSINTFELPIVQDSEYLFINCKHYNLLV